MYIVQINVIIQIILAKVLVTQELSPANKKYTDND